MSLFTRRRRWSLAVTAVVAGALSVVLLAYSLRLHRIAFVSGWLLLGSVLLLAGYNVRKKLTLFPLLSATVWLQGHIYVGLLSGVLFVWHTRCRWPSGPLEVTLAALFLVIAGSGLVGLWLSRTVPARLADRGQEVIFERIPQFRRQLRERAEELVLKAIQESGSSTLADFYQNRLASFFAGPRDRWRHLCQSTRSHRILQTEMQALERYLGEKERPALGELIELVEAKDALDYHYAMQGLLKAWLFVHVPLTFVLLIVVAVHVVTAYVYSGVP